MNSQNHPETSSHTSSHSMRQIPVKIGLSFNNSSFYNFSLGSRYYNAGPHIPRSNNTLHLLSSSPQGTIVSPAYEFRHDGTVTEWEFEGAKTGNVRLQVG